MGRYANWIIGIAVVTFFIGCNNVKFNKDETFNKCQNFNQDCIHDPALNIDIFDYTITIGQGLADILFIDDNSGSMSTEQNKMAPAFASFINSLAGIDYHIAITTTDVTGPANPARSDLVQDGRLIDFVPGLKFLQNSTANSNALFQNTIRRAETVRCEQSNFSNCPSSDERGIFAAKLAVSRNEGGFIRPNAHLAVVILSDEDVRGTGFSNPTRGFEPTNDDRAESFLDLFYGPSAQYADKSVAVHSIIVRPGDTNCRNIQNSQSPNAPGPVFGQFGNEYARLSEMTSGTIGDICAGDYTQQAGAIGYSIRDKVKDHKIACDPLNEEVIVTLTPPRPDINISVDFDQHMVIFSQQLPPGSKARFQYKCATL